MDIISGVVDPHGKPFSGSGYRVDKTDQGVFTLLFDIPFSAVPGASATQIYPWPLNRESKGGSPLDNAVIAYVSNDRVRIVTGDSKGDRQDRAFAFVVVGV